jgi:tryptophan synthase alpha chain
VLMGYYNRSTSIGVERFQARPRTAGRTAHRRRPAAGRGRASCACRRLADAACNFIRLATPTTDDSALPAVLRNTSGFVYYVVDPRHHRHAVGQRDAEVRKGG